MKRLVLILLAVVFASILPLALGAESVLLIGLPGGLPLGTLLAALAFAAGAGVPLAASRPDTFLQTVSRLVLAAAVLWLPVGIYLSGNPALNFVDDASDSALFWRLTAGLGVLILVTMLWAAVDAVTKHRAQPSSPAPSNP
ncbi:MAG: hypothetical protein AAGI08_17870 [Bacteroidota bacterium]